MKLLISVGLSTFYGLSIRAIFGMFDEFMPLMTVTFFFVVPWLIGYITVILLPYKESNTSGLAFIIPILPVMVIFLIIWMWNMEGLICLAMAFPLFAAIAGWGGTVAHRRKKRKYELNKKWDFEKEDWEKPGALKISFLFLIPIFAALLEGDRVSAVKELTIVKQIEIQASANKVWNTMTSKSLQSVVSSDLDFSNSLGFPRHLSTSVNLAGIGGSRVAVYQKGLIFEETITRFDPGHQLGLGIKTDPSKISKAIMDEHIAIGGKHVQLLEDIYTLSPLANGNTSLTLSSKMSINTPFNWYAGIWAKIFMGEILHDELITIKRSSER